MQEAQTWRKFLGTIISNAREKQRIANELGVKPITLTRWVSGESDPRSQNLRLLLSVLPGQREQLLDLIRAEEGLEEFSNITKDDTFKDIPSDFYSSIFTTRASITENLHYWSICQAILRQALGQLDPDRLGMAVWVVRCMPPSGSHNKVRSLRENVGTGTPPWGGNLEQKAMFLGAESLAGNVATLCRPSIIENLDEEHNLLPAMRVEHEKSCAIYPILYAGRIAGVFLVSSTQHNYFLSQARATLVQSYADMLALAFEPEDFYEPEEIALCVMPYHNEQKEYFAPFRVLVSNTIREAAQNAKPISNIEAEMRVWQQLEEKLIQLCANKREVGYCIL
ncbi:MAG: hypothetical protein NVS4B11_25180 [Ktedonobacteraceae bacterium]